MGQWGEIYICGGKQYDPDRNLDLSHPDASSDTYRSSHDTLSITTLAGRLRLHQGRQKEFKIGWIDIANGGDAQVMCRRIMDIES